MKTEILYGFHSTQEAIKAGRRTVSKVYVSSGKTSRRLQAVISLAESRDIPVETVSQNRLGQLAPDEKHQRVCARAGPYPMVTVARMLEAAGSGGTPPLLMLLDHIVDPQNLGGLVRSALCAGVDGICIPKDRSASPTPTVSRVSAGALEHTLMCSVTNMVATIKTMKQMGLWVIGLNRDAEASIYTTDFSVPLALIIGGEKKGIGPLVRKHCDLLVSIPQGGKIDSLNASVAGAVAMYEVFRQRQSAGPPPPPARINGDDSSRGRGQREGLQRTGRNDKKK